MIKEEQDQMASLKLYMFVLHETTLRISCNTNSLSLIRLSKFLSWVGKESYKNYILGFAFCLNEVCKQPTQIYKKVADPGFRVFSLKGKKTQTLAPQFPLATVVHDLGF